MDCEVVEGSGTGMVDEVVGKSCVGLCGEELLVDV